MQAEHEMQQLRSRIAEVYARRERLKQALASGAVKPRAGFAQLDATDAELSDLDSRFKTLWDRSRAPVAAPHPAARWARATVFEPDQLDCVAAIMLKVLDGKCKMEAADRAAIAAVYDVVRDRPGRLLDAAVHELIARARREADPALAARVHEERVRAEALIDKPVMKAFKARLSSDMPRIKEEP